MEYQQEVKDCVEKLQQLQGTLTQHKINDIGREKIFLENELKAAEAVNSLRELRQTNDALCLQNLALSAKVEELETELLVCLQDKGRSDPASRLLLHSKENLALIR